MDPLSEGAGFILERMEPGRPYQPHELRTLAPDISAERLREIMHELWIDRQIERVGHRGWRRHRSSPPHRSRPASGEVQLVKPEDLFDYATFGDFFK